MFTLDPEIKHYALYATSVVLFFLVLLLHSRHHRLNSHFKNLKEKESWQFIIKMAITSLAFFLLGTINALPHFEAGIIVVLMGVGIGLYEYLHLRVPHRLSLLFCIIGLFVMILAMK